MIIPVLTAKLSKPQLPDDVISRESVLKDCDWARVILVSSQAGSGKSTIVSAWLSEERKAYCWYTIDDWDNELMQFFAHLIVGIKSIDAHASETLRQLLDTFKFIGFDTFLRALINQLHAISSPYVFVFDDYHVIRNDLIHQVIRTLFDHFPPSMQLVLITREDPPFSFAKMRADKRLLELRISQLRFTEEEVKAYFLQQLHISLEKKQIQNLILRTEGWIAGLQMIALTMQGVDDVVGSIEDFSNTHYYIMDYLMEEILERQTPETKTFLLRTSILELFTDALCDAVVQLETGSSNVIIERLVKTNCFIISTELSHNWFRYHHLFRDFLRQRLEQQSRSDMESLHRLAGLWFKTNGFEQEAIDHFLKANAFEEAAALIECKWAEMDVKLQSASWLEMAKALPSHIIERSPILTMGYGWTLLDMGDVEACTVWFDKAQGLYNLCQTDVHPEGIIINDMTQFELLPATIASAYGYIAASTGDVEGIFTHTRYALERIPSDQYIKRGVLEMLIGFAHWGNGDLHEAESVIILSLKKIRRAVNPLIENSYYMMLGELYIQQNALCKAKSMFEEIISRLIKDNIVTILLPSLYLGLAKIAFLQNENSQAYALLEKSKENAQKYALMDWKYKYYLLLARVYYSEGLFDLSRDCINESKMHYHINPVPCEVNIDDMEKKIEAAAANHQPSFILDVKNENKTAFNKEYANQALSEPLTVRELEVLSLIASGLSNQEISNKLFIALSTVKGYNQNIFGKLEVNRRTKAVAKALELGLV